MALIEFEEYKQKLNNLEPDLDELEKAYDLEHSAEEVEELENRASEPGFWDDMEKSQKILQRTKALKDKIEGFHNLKTQWEDLLTLCDLAIEAEDESMLEELTTGFAELTDELERRKLATLLLGEYDANNAILSFHAGAGGTEAQDWCEMLYRMYTRWAERHGFTHQLLDRLVRISPFDSSGRRHTSFSAVEVMPEIDDDNTVEIRPEDIEMQVFRSSGAGGQHINKTSSAVRLIHKPTGIVVSCQTERSQFQNKDNCMKMLRSKLMEIKEREHLDKIEDIKGDQKKIEWGSQIRSYVFMPYTLAKDTRTGFENSNIDAVMDGDLDGFINAYLTAQATGTLQTK